MMKQQESNKQPLGGVTIKTEPGTSSTPVMQRLPSLRPPRDLSLSAYSQKMPNLNQSKNKRVYVPNLHIQRNKPIENSTTKTESVKPNLPERNERGRGRMKRNLIQLNHGLFSEGVPVQKGVGRGRFRNGDEDKADILLKKPTLKLKQNFKVDKEEEENTMKQLLQDDFIDDPNLEPDFDNCPITLPLLNSKKELGLKKKSDMKLVDKKENLTINDVFFDATTPDPGFIFLQLPSSMPGLRGEAAEASLKHNPQATTSSGSSQPTNKAESECCLLSALPGGQIGKLQILKSGRACLVFGDTKMWLEMGTQATFKQDLVSVNLDKETHTGHMVNLGPVSVRMVATPDWEGIMAALKKEKQASSV